MDTDRNDVSLSDVQLTLMRVLWARPDSSTADIVEALHAQRPMAHTTVATMLTRLEKRGVVHATRDGRQLIYRAAISESQVQRSMVSGMLSNLFQGNARALLSHLLREDEIGADDLEQLKALIERKGKSDV